MSPLSQAVADYLTMRRALGYKMDKAERLVGQFTAFAEELGETHVRTETALAWATLPSDADPIWTSRRLAEVRIFARHLRTLDPRTEVPPADLLPARGRRATPYLYTPQEVADLMRATAILRGSHVQATYRTLIGLLAATGMRVGEAIGLDSDDFDTGSGMLTIRHGKFDKSRALPLHRLSNLRSGNSARSGSRILAFPLDVGLGVRGPFFVDLDEDGGDEALESVVAGKDPDLDGAALEFLLDRALHRV
jgi:integrase/recombinase XerD